MEAADVSAELAKVVHSHINTSYYEALLKAFLTEVNLCGIVLAPAQDVQGPCVLDTAERSRVGLAVIEAKENFMRPFALLDDRQRWLKSASHWGEDITWANKFVAALESHGLTLVVADQEARARRARSVSVDAIDDCLDFPLDLSSIPLPLQIDTNNPTLRVLIKQAIEEAGSNSEAATAAVCRVLGMESV